MPSRRKLFTQADRRRILAAAEREGLSGPKAAKKFGISTLTYYTWRKKAKAAGGSAAKTGDGSLARLVRAQVQAKVRGLLPGIVGQEVGNYLNATFGKVAKGRLKV